MACIVGFGAYRYEVFEDHRIPVRVIGPDGRQSKHLSRACSWIWGEAHDVAKAKRWISSAIWMLNVVHDSLPANDDCDVADRFVSDVAGCRRVQDRFLTALNIRSRTSTDQDGSLWLKPSARMYGRVSDAVAACGMVTRALTADGVFAGQDPSKVDRAVSRIEGKGSVTKVTRRGVRTDVDNRLRLGPDPTVAPRFDDPRFYHRLRKGMERVGAPEPIRLICDMGYTAGGRAMSILGLDMFDVLVRPKRPGYYPSPNKGDDSAEDRRFVMIPHEIVHRRILAWIDGGRKELTGDSLEDLRLIAADPARRATLRGRPLFTENGTDPIRYDRLYRVLRRAAERMDLFIDDDEYRSTGRKRMVTFHYLRHEYVHRRLDHAATLKGAEKAEERKAIVAYMKWSSEAMLDWYSMHHVVKLAETAAAQHNERQDETLEGAAHEPVGDIANDDELDEIMRAMG